MFVDQQHSFKCLTKLLKLIEIINFFSAAVLGEEAQRSERLRHRRGAGENDGAAERPSG